MFTHTRTHKGAHDTKCCGERELPAHEQLICTYTCIRTYMDAHNAGAVAREPPAHEQLICIYTCIRTYMDAHNAGAVARELPAHEQLVGHQGQGVWLH